MGHHDKAAFEANKLSKRLHRLTGQAIIDFNMIEAGDRVMVCMSGGKSPAQLPEENGGAVPH